jgi:phosphatidylserine/phosphatidylglycerophosphate/cardiolipin synthase-like enzyme
MDDAELIGGVLNGAADPRSAAKNLNALLLAGRADALAARRAGFDPDLVRIVGSKLGGNPNRIEMACALGAAWVMGRRSVPMPEPWDLVASLPQGTRLPAGLRRTTGETLMRLVVEARHTIRLVSPFIDRSGLDFLADALAAATRRGVRVEVLLPTRSTHAGDAIDELRRSIRDHGAIERLTVAALQTDAPWAHLKVLTADSAAAYIGSANVTGAGIAGHNLELGVLISGPTVAVVEEIVDQFRQE